MTDTFYDLANPNFVGIMWRFSINIFFLFILIRLIYYRYSRKEKFLFSFFLMGIMTFFITSMLRSVFIEMGMAVGLFAVLGILRLRTRNFSVKDMAYTFAILGISVINSLKLVKFPVLGVIVINMIIMLSALFLEWFNMNHKSESYSIVYENLDLLRPEKKQKLLKDVAQLTGKNVLKVKIRRVDYIKKIAVLEVCYKDDM